VTGQSGGMRSTSVLRPYLSGGSVCTGCASAERQIGVGYPQSTRRAAFDLADRRVDWTEVTELVIESYRLQAPKRLIQLLTD
jgi:hypothetical protein